MKVYYYYFQYIKNKTGSIIYMGLKKKQKNSINNKFIVLCFCQKDIRKEFVFMQNNFITFRPEIKDVKIKKLDYETVYLDEFKGNADKEKYQLAIYDTNHILIDILKDRKSSTIREFLLCHKNSIKKVGMYMFMQFRNTVYSCLPHADIVADKYHVIRQANWMIRDVRIRLFNSDAKYREYKKYWKLIAKNPNSAFSPSQKKRLKKLKNLSEIFSRAYDLRTKFFSIFEIKDVTIFSHELKNLIGELKESGIKECIKLGETLSNWEEEINNIQKYNINNGFVEGKNNKIKVIKRLSYGIKKIDNLKKLIQLRIS